MRASEDAGHGVQGAQGRRESRDRTYVSARARNRWIDYSYLAMEIVGQKDCWQSFRALTVPALGPLELGWTLRCTFLHLCRSRRADWGLSPGWLMTYHDMSFVEPPSLGPLREQKFDTLVDLPRAPGLGTRAWRSMGSLSWRTAKHSALQFRFCKRALCWHHCCACLLPVALLRHELLCICFALTSLALCLALLCHCLALPWSFFCGASLPCLSCSTLLGFALPCLALPCFAFALPCLALSSLALFCRALPCLVLPSVRSFALPCIAFARFAFPCLDLSCFAIACLALPYRTVPSLLCIVLLCFVLP